ncbi:hypothetical protein Trydic_g9982 [Trypoxylus dichotomus]
MLQLSSSTDEDVICQLLRNTRINIPHFSNKHDSCSCCQLFPVQMVFFYTLIQLLYIQNLYSNRNVKVPKSGNPLRPIVSTCGSPTYELAKYVVKQLAQYSGNTKSFVTIHQCNTKDHQAAPKRLQPDLINLAEEFYEQANGTAMGSPLSPVITNIFMEAFEHETIESSRMEPKCWYTFIILPHGPRTL